MHSIMPKPSSSWSDTAAEELNEITALLWGFVPHHVVAACLKAGLFDYLANGKVLSIKEVTELVDWRPRPTQRVLDILAMLGFVTIDAVGVRATAKTLRWLDKASHLYIGDYFERATILEDGYHNLGSYLTTDQPSPKLRTATKRAFGLEDPETDTTEIEKFARVLSATSGPVADEFVRVARVPKSARVLDLGAGSGVFAKALLESGHEEPIDLLDTPLVCEASRRMLRSYVSHVRWLPTDWHIWQPDKPYDVILVHHALHEERFDVAADLLRKCTSALVPGGKVHVIGLMELDDSPSPMTRLFALNLLLELSSDNTSLAWLRSVAPSCGLEEESVNQLPGSRVLWTARRTWPTETARHTVPRHYE